MAYTDFADYEDSIERGQQADEARYELRQGEPMTAPVPSRTRGGVCLEAMNAAVREAAAKRGGAAEECELGCGRLVQVLSNDPDAALVCEDCSHAPNGEVA